MVVPIEVHHSSVESLFFVWSFANIEHVILLWMVFVEETFDLLKLK